LFEIWQCASERGDRRREDINRWLCSRELEHKENKEHISGLQGRNKCNFSLANFQAQIQTQIRGISKLRITRKKCTPDHILLKEQK